MMLRHLGSQIKSGIVAHSLTVDVSGIGKALVHCRFETNAVASGKKADWRIHVFKGAIAGENPYDSDIHNFGVDGLTYNETNGRIIHPGLTAATKAKRFATAVDVVFLVNQITNATLNVRIKPNDASNVSNINSITIFGVDTLHSS